MICMTVGLIGDISTARIGSLRYSTGGRNLFSFHCNGIDRSMLIGEPSLSTCVL